MPRTAVEYRTASLENYKRFCKEHTEINLSIDEWRGILYSFSDLFKEYILETGEKIKFPSGWGEFSVEKKKRAKTITYNGKERIILPIDWQRTKEKGKRIYNFNFHTEGYSFKWKWFRETSIFKQRIVWYFKPSRPTSRIIAHYLNIDKEYQHKYLQWSSLIKHN